MCLNDDIGLTIMSLQIFVSNFPLSVFNFQFLSGRSATRRAFRYIFARTLAKDAAAIPNALGLRAMSCELWAKLLITHSSRFVANFQLST